MRKGNQSPCQKKGAKKTFGGQKPARNPCGGAAASASTVVSGPWGRLDHARLGCMKIGLDDFGLGLSFGTHVRVYPDPRSSPPWVNIGGQCTRGQEMHAIGGTLSGMNGQTWKEPRFSMPVVRALRPGSRSGGTTARTPPASA